jgi:purine-nucleoside phosphorylase
LIKQTLVTETKKGKRSTPMENYKKKVLESTAYLKAKIKKAPHVGVLTGTGLGESTQSLNISSSFDYKSIPNFPVSTVESHHGRLLVGDIQGCAVMAMQGRFHLYEGYSALEVTFPIRVMQELGVKILILTNAAGGLNTEFNTGDIMLITDHINLTGSNPLIGPNEDRWGIRFPDMSAAYDKAMMSIAVNIAQSAGVAVRRGVYVGLKGPSLETPAEIRFLKTIGAEAVGFSTVQEVIAAIHAGMRVLGLAAITNVHDPENPVPATVKDIIEVAKTATPGLEKIIRKVVEKINETKSS